MQFRKLALAAAAMGGAAIVVAGCSSSNEPSPFENTVSATAALGALAGATCVLDLLPASDGFTPSAVTGPDGVARFSPAILESGPFQLTCSGGEYYNEATGAMVSFQNKQLRSIVTQRESAGPLGVAVTTATDLMVAALADPLTEADAALIVDAMTEVAIALGFPNLNLMLPPQVVNADNRAITNGAAPGLYAVLLAGLAQLADDIGLTPDELGAKLREDVVAGQPVGTSLIGTGGITSAADFLVQLDAAVNAIAAEILSPSIQANVIAQIAQQQGAASQAPGRGIITPMNPDPTPTPTPTGTPTPTATPTVTPTPPTGGTGGTGGSGGGGGGTP